MNETCSSNQLYCRRGLRRGLSPSSFSNSHLIWLVNAVTSTPWASKWSTTPECAWECIAS
ncbi:Uncharacterised protein [Mycobacterium tuberculosis]|nr:Uncharacterised protein [Mycobacterium tuberculosis]COX68095.1 Uncharacterised protein [Mycobacterium tuberculosis]